MTRSLVSLILLLFPLWGGTIRAADEPAEAKLRAALRNTMLQLRTAQSERAALQASQVESDQKVKELTAQVGMLNKQAGAFEKHIADQEAQLVKFKDAVGNWERAYKEAVDLANAKEAARAKLAADAIALQRRVDDQQSKNGAMFRIGNEILTRYEHYGLGDALAAKEPFIGLTRVKLENLVQSYQDKLIDQKIEPSKEAPEKQNVTTGRAFRKTQTLGNTLTDKKGKP